MTDILIIIPAYNSSHFVGSCITSVQSQTYAHWHLVIVDDGSTDDTAAIALTFAETDSRITVCQQENAGVAAARNRGLSYLTPSIDFLLWLDNDDIILPDTLEALKRKLLENEAATAAFGLPRPIDRHGKIINDNLLQSFGFSRSRIHNGVLVDDQSEFVDFSHFAVWDCIATPGQVLIRRCIIDKVGGFDSNTVPSDDWDLWLRLTLHGPFVCVKQFVINKRSHEENVSKQGRVMAVAEPIIRRKLATSDLLTPEQRRIAKLGHFHSCRVKLSWCKNQVKRKKFAIAAKSAYSALKSYSAYLKTPYKT